MISVRMVEAPTYRIAGEESQNWTRLGQYSKWSWVCVADFVRIFNDITKGEFSAQEIVENFIHFDNSTSIFYFSTSVSSDPASEGVVGSSNLPDNEDLKNLFVPALFAHRVLALAVSGVQKIIRVGCAPYGMLADGTAEPVKLLLKQKKNRPD